MMPPEKISTKAFPLAVKERGILFSAPMVRALLDSSKTQTRRPVKPWQASEPTSKPAPPDLAYLRDFTCYRSTCPYGQPGDRLWVRETHAKVIGQSGGWIETDYRATYTHGDRLGDLIGVKRKWTPAIHMPRAASRILLEITDVRVERLKDISRGDAMAEGCPFPNMAEGADPRSWYAELWDQINGAGAWDANPWVWAVSFKRVEGAKP